MCTVIYYDMNTNHLHIKCVYFLIISPIKPVEIPIFRFHGWQIGPSFAPDTLCVMHIKDTFTSPGSFH